MGAMCPVADIPPTLEHRKVGKTLDGTVLLSPAIPTRVLALWFQCLEWLYSTVVATQCMASQSGITPSPYLFRCLLLAPHFQHSTQTVLCPACAHATVVARSGAAALGLSSNPRGSRSGGSSAPTRFWGLVRTLPRLKLLDDLCLHLAYAFL